MAVEDPISPNKQDVFMHILLNNMILLNSKYDRKEVLKKQRKKFYLVKDKKALMMNWSFCYGVDMISSDLNILIWHLHT